MPMNLEQFGWILPVTAAATALLIMLLNPLARQAKLVDQPSQRKIHDSATPMVGGAAIFIALATALLWMVPSDYFTQTRFLPAPFLPAPFLPAPFLPALAAGSLLMLLTGMSDDRFQLSAALRFLLQIGACLLMILYGEVRLEDFGRLLYNDVLGLGWLAGPITIFAALGVINAYNMIDGLDGLAGSIFVVAAAGMGLFAARGGQGEVLWTLLLSISAVVGFMLLNARLPWNNKARVFLGDSGSLLLGFILAWSFISLGSDHNETGVRAFMPMTAVWLLGVPLLDTTTLMWRRWRSGGSALVADQNHLHHAFLRAGFSVGQTWLIITLAALATGAVGILFELTRAPDYLSFWTFMAVAIAYSSYMKKSWQIQRFLGRNFIYNDFDL